MVIVVVWPSIMDIAAGNDLRATEEADEASGGRRGGQAVISCGVFIVGQGTEPFSRTGIVYERICTFLITGTLLHVFILFSVSGFVVTRIVDC